MNEKMKRIFYIGLTVTQIKKRKMISAFQNRAKQNMQRETPKQEQGRQKQVNKQKCSGPVG